MIKALVTGASAGIGRAIVLALAEQGRRDGVPVKIAAAGSRPGAGLDSIVAELEAAGAQARWSSPVPDAPSAPAWT